MVRIPGGWSWEPLTGMILVWWIVVAITDGLVLRRGQLSLRRTAVIATCLPILIMFPFKGISLSHERAQWNNLMRTSPQPITQAGWGGWWTWHRLPDGNIVPKCLVWRVSPQGMVVKCNQFNEQHLSLMRLSEELADEVQVIGLNFRPRKKIAGEEVRILNQNLSQLHRLLSLEITGEYSAKSPNIELDILPEQRELVSLKIWGGPPIEEGLFKKLTTSIRLDRIVIGYNEIEDQVFRSFKSQSDRLSLDVSGTSLQSESIISVFQNARGISGISINPKQLNPELIRMLRPSRSNIQVDVFVSPNLREMVLGKMLEEVIHAFMKLELNNRSSQSRLNFHRLRIQALPEISTTENKLVCFYDCELEYDVLKLVATNQLSGLFTISNSKIQIEDLQRAIDESLNPSWQKNATQVIAAFDGANPNDMRELFYTPPRKSQTLTLDGLIVVEKFQPMPGSQSNNEYRMSN